MSLLTELVGWEMDFAISMSRLRALPCFSVGFSIDPPEVYVFETPTR
jgi:hypothetical protein